MKIKPDYQGWGELEARTGLSRDTLLLRKKRGLPIFKDGNGWRMIEKDYMDYLGKVRDSN